MAWIIEWGKSASKKLKKLDHETQKQIINYLDNRIASDYDPRRLGKPLRHDKFGLWRYRIGKVRIIVSFEDDRMIVLIIDVGNRSMIYEQ